jgi:hypothetical protein
MNEYFADNPPLHLLVKGFMGFENKKKKKIENTQESIHELLKDIPHDVNKNKKIKVRMI